MPVTIPGPISTYRGNYATLPASTLRPPPEGNRTIPVEIYWLRDAQSPQYTVDINVRQQQVLSVSQICALHIDNTGCSSAINVLFPDTHFQLFLGANAEGFYPVVTSSLEFFVWCSTAPGSNTEHTVFQILNFLPPPMEFGIGPASTGTGTVTSVATAAPLAGGPITSSGTISLAVPLAINYGGTNATTAPVALDQLSGATGTVAGVLTRASAGTWSVAAAGTGTITGVTAGTGLTGGGVSGAVTVAMVVPVSIPNGGTGASSAAAALTALGAAPINNPMFTGFPSGPTATLGTNSLQFATCAFVQNALSGSGLGTVTSVAAGTGLTASPSPITGAGTISLAAPVSVANGGTGSGTYPANFNNIGGPNLTLDAAGNVLAAHSLSINGAVVPSNASASNILGGASSGAALVIGTAFAGTGIILGQNAYNPAAGGLNYSQTGVAGYLSLGAGGTLSSYTFPSGTGGTALPAGTQTMTLDAGGNLTVSSRLMAPGAFSNFGNSAIAGPGAICINAYTGSGIPYAVSFNWGGNATAGGGTPVGSISCTSSATSFNGVSDIRLKTGIEPLDASEIVAALRPIKFRWRKVDAGELDEAYGFSAQDCHAVFPQAVTPGEGDPGEENFRPWMMDHSKLVPLLVAEVQRLRKILEPDK